MPSIFSKIISGDIPCYKLAEDDDFIAFLDIQPLAAGHALVVPKIEIDYIFDLDDELLSRALPFAKRVAKGIQAVISCNRIGIAVIGLEVPHAHIHLAPISNIGDLNFSKVRVKLSPEEYKDLAEKIALEIK